MGRKNYLPTVALVLLMSPVHSQDNLAAQIDAVFQSIKAGDVASVEVFGVPPDALFRTSLKSSSPREFVGLQTDGSRLGFADGAPRCGACGRAKVGIGSAKWRGSRLAGRAVGSRVLPSERLATANRSASFYHFDRSGRRGRRQRHSGLRLRPISSVNPKQALHAQID